MTDTCDWCGNPGHTPADHPLPEGHEHYDPGLDNPLMGVAVQEFADWQQRQQAPAVPPQPASVSPLGRLLGSGPDVQCQPAAQVHWWQIGARRGDACLCGEKTREGR